MSDLPVLITFDGFQGSGKTTQIELLRPNIKYNTDIFVVNPSGSKTVMLDYISWVDGLLESLGVPDCDIRISKAILGKLLWLNNCFSSLTEVYLLDWFWEFSWLYMDKMSVYDDFLRLIPVQPSVSFWLKVSRVEIESRTKARPNYIGASSLDLDDLVLELSRKFPFFYVLDGEQSVSAVHDEIMSILQAHDLAWIFK